MPPPHVCALSPTTSTTTLYYKRKHSYNVLADIINRLYGRGNLQGKKSESGIIYQITVETASDCLLYRVSNNRRSTGTHEHGWRQNRKVNMMYLSAPKIYSVHIHVLLVYNTKYVHENLYYNSSTYRRYRDGIPIFNIQVYTRSGGYSLVA